MDAAQASFIDGFWTASGGQIINGSIRLGELVEAESGSALYTTDSADEPRVVRVWRVEESDFERRLARVRAIAELSHPNLISLTDAGAASIQDTPVVYAVMERAEENLAGVLRERSLSAEETLEVAAPAAEVLGYLHERGWVHGDLRPSSIFAIGNTLKISSEGLVRVDEEAVESRRSVYDAPEIAGRVRTVKSDVWSLGITLFEALTQQTPAENGNGSVVVPAEVAEPLGSILRHCVETDPERRATPDGILRELRGSPVIGAVPLQEAPVIEQRPQSGVRVPRDLSRAERAPRVPLQQPASERNPRKWILIGVGAAALIGVIAGLLPKTNRTVPTVAPAANSAAVQPAPAPAPVTKPAVNKPSPMASSRAQRTPAPARAAPSNHASTVAGRKADSWYVVVATYSQRSAAEKRAREISKRWARFQAEVFDPPVSNPHHLVVIGRNLSEDSAETMRLKALAAGLPRDVYIKRFPRG